MYGVDPAAGDAERTAFRRSEKRYKLYKPLDPNSRNKKPVVNPVDLSDVVDFRQVLESFQRTGDTPPGIVRFECQELDRPIFCFRDRPGFYFIPCALSFEEQCHWIRQSLLSFPQPPNRTNLTALYGPITDLLIAVQEKKVLIEDNVAAHLGHESTAKENNIQSSRYVFSEASINSQAKGLSKSVAASVLLRKLRWSTLGLQFDWSKRNYDLSLPHNKISDALCTLAKKMAVPAMASGEEFHPEAAIVNYFGPSDMLGGHLDDMEADWSKPIVNISLGCKAIFLLGGKTREDIPVAMFLRSGDVVLMSGEARECFHGVPRIFTDNIHSEVSAFMSHFSGEDDQVFSDYLKSSRININIRQPEQMPLQLSRAAAEMKATTIVKWMEKKEAAAATNVLQMWVPRGHSQGGEPLHHDDSCLPRPYRPMRSTRGLDAVWPV